MNLLYIILLGIIQGLTEFFPVSSSGHLVLFQNFLGLREPQIFVDVMLHLGTVISLVVFLRRDILHLINILLRFLKNPVQNFSDPQLKLILYLILASIPTALMGYYGSDFFESLFASLPLVGLALLITSTLLFLTKYAAEKNKILWFHPLLIGILQGMAIVPGFSRSGFTIGGALFLGWKKKEAARFSFLLSIPAILGACLFQWYKVDLSTQLWIPIALGTLIATLFGYLALVYLFNLINRGKFYYFSYYCFPLGLLTFIISFLL